MIARLRKFTRRRERAQVLADLAILQAMRPEDREIIRRTVEQNRNNQRRRNYRFLRAMHLAGVHPSLWSALRQEAPDA